MPAHGHPGFDIAVNVADELARLRAHALKRKVPPRDNTHLLLGSWNIANLGDPAQERTSEDLDLIAEILGWFDVVAIQENKRDLTELRAAIARMPGPRELLFTDVGGNYERLVYLYDPAKCTPMELISEIAVAPGSRRWIRISKTLPPKDRPFRGFDRNPFAAALNVGGLPMIFVNAHLVFGSARQADVDRRALEAFAVGRWADLERRSDHAYAEDIVVIGDLNMPRAEPGDDIYEALKKRGLFVPEHASRIGTTLKDDHATNPALKEAKHYDQVAFFRGTARKRFVGNGVIDFDKVVFPEAWARGIKDFRRYVKYHLSDHRPIWARFKL